MVILFNFLFSLVATAQITSLKHISELCNAPNQKQPVVAIREFVKGGVTSLLIVDSITLATSLKPRKELRCKQLPEEQISKALALSADLFQGAPGMGGSQAVGNFGFKQFDFNCAEGVVLTVDMCPGSKAFDRDFFKLIAKMSSESRKTVHLGIAVTGARLQQRPAEFEEMMAILKPSMLAGQLKITWINHSHSHPYTRGLPYEKNFLTGVTSTDFLKEEVLATESVMLERGLNPSLFFRFPGLMSTVRQIDDLGRLGLVTLATSAWLALDGFLTKTHQIYGITKDQRPQLGRVVLIHGNGAEPDGIRKAQQWLTRLQKNSESHLLISPEMALRCFQ